MEASHSTIIVMRENEMNELKTLEPYTNGKRNDNGQTLINFAIVNNLHIMII